MPAALSEEPEELDREGRIAALMDLANRAFQYAEDAANGAERVAARSTPGTQEKLDAVMFATHASWVDAKRHHRMAREAHADGQRSRLEHHASQVINAAVDTQEAAGVATTAQALADVLDGLRPAAERARRAEAWKKLQEELDRELTAVTRMDAVNRDLLRRARWHAENEVPGLGWWPALVADLTHAHQGLLCLDETGTPRLMKKPADGAMVPGRKVNAGRVAMLRTAGFLETTVDGETPTLLHPSSMGREALYLATLYPEGLHADERAAYEARYAAGRRPWMNSEERKSAARRLPPLQHHAMRAVREKPVLLEEAQVPRISADDAARHADLADLAQRLWGWAALRDGERSSDAAPETDAGAAARPEAQAGWLKQGVGSGDEAAALEPPASRRPTPGQMAHDAAVVVSPASPGSGSVAHPVSEAAPPLHPSAAPTTIAATTGITGKNPPSAPHPRAGTLDRGWALDLPHPSPHSNESRAAAWALRGGLADGALVELLAAVDDEEAFSRWKNNHVRYPAQGTGHANRHRAPASSFTFSHTATKFEATIGDQSVTLSWDRIRAWLRSAPDAQVDLLKAAKTAGRLLRGGRRGDALLAASGELDVAWELRGRVDRLTTQLLDHVIDVVAATPVPTGRATRGAAREAEGPSLRTRRSNPGRSPRLGANPCGP